MTTKMFKSRVWTKSCLGLRRHIQIKKISFFFLSFFNVYLQADNQNDPCIPSTISLADTNITKKESIHIS